MSTVNASVALSDALDALVARGELTPAQRESVLAEMSRISAVGPSATPSAAAPSAALSGVPAALPAARGQRRTVSDVLVEVGLYVGSALIVAAGLVLVAQNWESMSLGTQIGMFGAIAVVAAVLAVIIGHGAPDGSARRRLSGLMLVATAVSAAATTALVLQETSFAGTAAFAVAVVVMVVAQQVARSAITELAAFVACFGLLEIAIQDFRPEGVAVVDEWGNEFYEAPMYDALMPLVVAAFGAFWALVVSRRMMHREVAVFVGMAAALISTLPVIATPDYRLVGMVVMGLIAGLGFWRFMAEGYWPWLASAIAAVTAIVFWAVGGAHRPALAILVAGLVLLGGSGLGWRIAQRRRAALKATEGSTAEVAVP